MRMSCNKDSSSCGLFTIAYGADITFVPNLEQSIYNVAQMRLHLHYNINHTNMSTFPKHPPQ
jgi:hypothetical protein